MTRPLTLYRHGQIAPRVRGISINHTTEPTSPTSILPLLAQTLSELNRRGVRWCLLRGESELEHGGDDVDLLLAADDLPRATAAFDSLGFAPLASWGRGSHRFFLTYDRDVDVWIKLDVVTRLTFGPHALMETDAASACLERRAETGGLWRLAEADQFWALLLHCILDRGDVPQRHATVLREAASNAPMDSPLADWFVLHAPVGWDVPRVIRTADAGEWATLSNVGSSMRASRTWRRPASRITFGQRAIARRLTKLRTLLLGRGITLALLGPDGAGKSTLAADLDRTFFFPVRSIYMGLYGPGPKGRVPRGMAGRLGRQWGGYLTGLVHRGRGRLVVYDRFAYDVLLRPGAEDGRRARLRRWLLTHAIPRPDLVIVLDAPAEQLYARKQEHDIPSLEVQRRAYLDVASRLPGAQVVQANRNPAMVRRDVTALVWDRYRRRLRRRQPASSR